MPVGHLADLIWRYKSALGYLRAALFAAGLLIMFTDRAAGVVRVPVDCSKLGWLMLTATGLALILSGVASGLVKLTGPGHQSVNLERAIRPQINANKRKLTMPYRSDSPHLPGADKVLGSPLNHWR